MKKFIFAVCFSMAAMMVATHAFALEADDYHARGIAEGYASGYMAPAGFYFTDDSWFAPSFVAHEGSQANPNTKMFVYLNVPSLFWSSGCKILGADYGAAITQPFLYQNIRAKIAPGSNLFVGGETWGAFNTVLTPYVLSWKLPCDFYLAHGFSVSLNDSTTSPGDSVASINQLSGFGRNLTSKTDGNLYLWSGNDTYTFTPTLGLSWLHAGWNISAGFGYTMYTKDGDTNYQNGDQFWGDYTIAKTCGKWTFGVVGESTVQIQADKFNAGDARGYTSQPGTKTENYTVGPLLGYNFGPCMVQFMYNFNIVTRNEGGGDWFNFRLIVPLGNPFAPAKKS